MHQNAIPSKMVIIEPIPQRKFLALLVKQDMVVTLAKIAKLGNFKKIKVKQHALNVQLDTVTYLMVRSCAILYLLVRTLVYTASKIVKLAIIAPVKTPIKPRAHPGHTPTQLGPFPASPVHPGHTYRQQRPLLAKRVVPTNSNPTPKPQHAFQ
jgi:hypothetical protein